LLFHSYFQNRSDLSGRDVDSKESRAIFPLWLSDFAKTLLSCFIIAHSLAETNYGGPGIGRKRVRTGEIFIRVGTHKDFISFAGQGRGEAGPRIAA
jgi:hypothetical protein